MGRNKGIRRIITFLAVSMASFFLVGCGGKEAEDKVIITLKENREEPLKIPYGSEIPKEDIFKITIEKADGDICDGEIKKLEIGKPAENKLEEEQTVDLIYDGEKVGELKVRLEKAELKGFSIGYKDDKVSWDKVSEAAEYKVYINDREVETISSSLTNNTEYLLTGYDYPSDVYRVKIEAVPKDNIRYKSSYSKELEIKKLPTPDNVVYKNGKISWDAVVEDKSCKYVVTINGKVYKETYDTFVAYNMVEGENRVEIKALASEEYVTSSNSVKCTLKKLEPVEEKISYNKGKIVWNAPEQKCKYKVKINGEEYETTETSYEYSLEIGKVYTVEIWAVAEDKYTIDSEVVKQTLQYNRLDKPELAVKQGKTDVNYILEVLNAKENVKYDVEIVRYVDEVQDSVSYDNLKDSKLEFEVGKDVTKIVVKAIAVDETGVYAESYEATLEQNIAHNKLQTPQVTVTKGVELGCYIISYQAVAGADRYLIEVVTITDADRILKTYDVSVIRREIEIMDNVVALEVSVTAYDESGVHDQSDKATVQAIIQ